MMRFIQIKSIALMFSCLLLISACASITKKEDRPRLTLVNLELLEATLFEQRYKLKFRIQNRWRDALAIEGLHFDLDINGKPFISGVSNQTVKVAALSEATIEVTGTSTLLGLARQLNEMQKSNGAGFSYRLKGKVNLSNQFYDAPFDYTGSFSPE